MHHVSGEHKHLDYLASIFKTKIPTRQICLSTRSWRPGARLWQPDDRGRSSQTWGVQLLHTLPQQPLWAPSKFRKNISSRVPVQHPFSDVWSASWCWDHWRASIEGGENIPIQLGSETFEIFLMQLFEFGCWYVPWINGFNTSFSPYEISKAREKAERERKIKEIEEARARVSIDILSEKEQELCMMKHWWHLIWIFRVHQRTHLSFLQLSRSWRQWQ